MLLNLLCCLFPIHKPIKDSHISFSHFINKIFFKEEGDEKRYQLNCLTVCTKFSRLKLYEMYVNQSKELTCFRTETVNARSLVVSVFSFLH